MYPAFTLIVCFAAFVAPYAAGAQFPQPNTNRDLKFPAARSKVSQLQYRVKRDTVDTCASITGFEFALSMKIPNPVAYAGASVCVCLNTLDSWLDANPDAQIFIRDFSRSYIADLVTELLTVNVGTEFNPWPENCVLPTNAARTCKLGSPCMFACEENYTLQDDACVCADPFLECNGICGDFPMGCSSQVPAPRKRSLPIKSLAQAKSACKVNESVCGIAGREDTLDFECIDTRVALDSCGGCLAPHPFYEPYRSPVKGVECGRLPGVIGVGCSDSKCLVTKCREGQQPSSDKSKCIANINNAFMAQSMVHG